MTGALFSAVSYHGDCDNVDHAGMAGRTNMVVGYWKGEFTHVPIAAAVSKRKEIDPKDKVWTGVLSSTGQPREM